MPQNSTHPSYDARTEEWVRCRDCYAGNDRIKGKGGIYLPQLSGQSPEDYAAYKKRGLFYGATQRTVDGITGAIMRKEPSVDIPDGLKDLLEDITFTGISFREFAKKSISDLFQVARIGILVDRAPDGDTRPYFAFYRSEDIINWWEEGGDLIRVMLKEETMLPDPEDSYKWKVEDRYRELVLEEGKYVQRLWKKEDKSDKFIQEGEDIVPTETGKPLDWIPFVIITPEGITSSPPKPPILDLVEINLSHYRSSADLEHGRHFTALPTIWFSGVTNKDLGDSIHIGSGKAIVLPPPEAKAGILEFKGEGLGELKDALIEKENQMAKLGARLLEDQSRKVETAETARIHAAAEMSVAVSISQSASEGLTRALRFLVKWEGQDEKKTDVELNKDFIDAKLASSDLEALLRTRQAGEISGEAFTWNLLQGELLPPDSTIETERGKIALEGPKFEEEGEENE